jgi:site-specific DNA recombinase
MKLLQAARITRLKDSSTSIEKQDDDMARWASANDHVIVDTAKDSGVSGAISPFERPDLGPWLTDPEKIKQYDGILASHLDRLGRSTNDFMVLLKWCKDNNKTIITTALGDKIDFSKGVGLLIGFIIVWLGEQELETDKRRTRETFEWLRDNGYLTGKCPFGFRIVTITAEGKKRKIIEPDPVNAPYVRDMVKRYLAGKTLAELCEWLDAEGVKPSGWLAWSKKPADKRGNEPVWQPASIMGLFRNPVLIGRLESEGDVVRDAKGQPLKRCKEILDDDTWQRLQAKLDTMPQRRSSAPKETSLLTGILFCAKCGGPMYRLTSTRNHPNGKTYVTVYYRCHGKPRKASKCRNMVRMEAIEAEVTDYILSHKSIEIMRPVVVKGNTYGKQLAEVGAAIKALDPAGEDYEARHAELFAEFRRLSALKPEPDRVGSVSTGRTLAGEWPAMDTAARRQALLDGEFTVTAVKSKDGLHVEVTPGEAYRRMVAGRRIPHPRV